MTTLNPTPAPEPDPPYVIRLDDNGADRICLSLKTINCIHGRRLKTIDKVPELCPACTWEAPRYTPRG